MTTYKVGENSIEGKCSFCGTYVTKGGVEFGARSVLCPQCAKKQDRTASPHGAKAGSR